MKRVADHILYERPRGVLSKSDRNNYIRAERGHSIHLAKRLNKICIRDKILSMNNIQCLVCVQIKQAIHIILNIQYYYKYNHNLIE